MTLEDEAENEYDLLFRDISINRHRNPENAHDLLLRDIVSIGLRKALSKGILSVQKREPPDVPAITQQIDACTQTIESKDVAADYFARGELYYRLNSYQEAFQDYTCALSLNPARQDYRYKRGLTALLLQEFEKGLDDLSQIDPASELYRSSLFFSATAYFRLHQHERALHKLFELDSLPKEEP